MYPENQDWNERAPTPTPPPEPRGAEQGCSEQGCSERGNHDDSLNTIALSSVALNAGSNSGGHRMIGPYTLLTLLGAGGMGEVWLAEQSLPVKRRVALKLIKAEIGSKEVTARFDAERQALALMNHPNIASILDVGTTEDGQPFFVMELVQGQPLTTYCDQNRLELNERLRLFAEVCSGVQHAHQKGIIHRDLKPGNILVGTQDGKPVPKIIDFGLAKATESTQRLTDQSVFTSIGQVLGTLKYMSPEQASLDAIDIDTRTDIYALGVILYELLTGSTPLDDSSIQGQAVLKVLEFIRDKEPVKPSSKLSSSTREQLTKITGQRQIDSIRLNRVLAGDLDWIVMKALEKDRTRRYESASGFAADIQRYLNNEPVIARPPSLSYRVRKFVRKHRVGVGAASLLGLALLAGLVGTGLGLVRALRAEQAAITAQNLAETETEAKNEALLEKDAALAAETRQRQYAESVADFVENDFLALTSVEGQTRILEELATTSFDPSEVELSKDTTLRELLDRAAEKLELRTDLAPLIEARLRSVIGNSYRANGDPAKSVLFLEKGYELRCSKLGPAHLDALASMRDLAIGCQAAGQLGRAVQLYEQTLELTRDNLGPEHENTLISMGNLAEGYHAVGELDKALALHEDSLELMKIKLGFDHPQTLSSMTKLAKVYKAAGQLDEALTLMEQTLELVKNEFGSEHLKTIEAMAILAQVYKAAGRLQMALPLYEQTLELSKAKFGMDSPVTQASLHNLGWAYKAAGEAEKGLPLLAQALELRKGKLALDHPEVLRSMGSLAMVYLENNQLDEALPLLEKTLELMLAKLGSDHPDTLTSMDNLAMAYQTDGKMDKALPLLEQTLELTKAKLGPDHPDTLTSMNNLASGYESSGDLEKALLLYGQTLKLRIDKLGPDHPATLISMNNLAWGFKNAGKLDKALPLLKQTLDLKQAKLGLDAPSTILSMINLAKGYQAANQHDKALPLLQRILELTEAKHGHDHLDTLIGMNNLAMGYRVVGQLDQSILLMETLVPKMQDKRGRPDRETQATIANLGLSYFEADRIDDAIPLLEEAFDSSRDFAELGWVKYRLLEAYAKGERVEEFQAMAEEALATARRDLPVESLELANALVSIGSGFLQIDSPNAAVELLREGHSIRQKLAAKAWNTFHAQSLLGGALLAQAKNSNEKEEKELLLAEAEPLLISGYQGSIAMMDSTPWSVRKKVRTGAIDWLIEYYTRQGQPDEANRYRKLREDESNTAERDPPL